MSEKPINPYAPPAPEPSHADQLKRPRSGKVLSGESITLASPLLAFVWEQYKKDHADEFDTFMSPSIYIFTESIKAGLLRKAKEVPILATSPVSPSEAQQLAKHADQFGKLSAGAWEEYRDDPSSTRYVWRAVDLASEVLKPPAIDKDILRDRLTVVYNQMKPHMDEFRDIVERNKERVAEKSYSSHSPGDPYTLISRVDDIEKRMQEIVKSLNPGTQFTNQLQPKEILLAVGFRDLPIGDRDGMLYQINGGYARDISAEDATALRGHVHALAEIVEANMDDINIATHHALYQQAERGLSQGVGRGGSQNAT